MSLVTAVQGKSSSIVMVDCDPSSRLLVAVGVIKDSEGRVLLAQRRTDVDQGGLWEFPGGKCETRESIFEALQRELFEELGIGVTEATPLCVIPYRYPKRAVELHVWEIQHYTGIPQSKEQQPLRWVTPNTLKQFAIPAANRGIVSRLSLSPLYAITPPEPLSKSALLLSLENVLKQGVRLVRFRAPYLSSSEYLDWVPQVSEVCHTYGAKCLGGPFSLAGELLQLGLDGIHLTSEELLQQPIEDAWLNSASCWLAASVHDAVQMNRAIELGVDFVTISPIMKTASHPDQTGIGWRGFAEIAKNSPYPCYALGGVGRNDLQKAKEAGGYGISAISDFFAKQYSS